MVKVQCEGCGAPYNVAESRIPANGLKMRCPSCGTTFLVHKAGAGAPAAGAPKPAAPKAAPKPPIAPIVSRAAAKPSPTTGAGLPGRAPALPRPGAAAPPPAASRPGPPKAVAAAPEGGFGDLDVDALFDAPADLPEAATGLPALRAGAGARPGSESAAEPDASFGDLPDIAAALPLPRTGRAARPGVKAPPTGGTFGDLPDLGADLPAPRGRTAEAAQGVAKVPTQAAPFGELPDLTADLPAPRGTAVPARRAPAPPTPATFGDLPDLADDLPAAAPRGVGPARQPPAPQQPPPRRELPLDDLPALGGDLPAVRARPGPGRPPAPAPSAPEPSPQMLDDDLGEFALPPLPDDAAGDLPAPRASSGGKQTMVGGFGGGGSPFGDLDLDLDFAAPKRAPPIAHDALPEPAVDLPEPAVGLPEPAARGGRAERAAARTEAFGSVRREQEDLPAPARAREAARGASDDDFGAIDLPELAADLPAAQGADDAFGSLDLVFGSEPERPARQSPPARSAPLAMEPRPALPRKPGEPTRPYARVAEPGAPKAPPARVAPPKVQRGVTAPFDPSMLPALAEPGLPAVAGMDLPALAEPGFPAIAHDGLPELSETGLPAVADYGLPAVSPTGLPAVAQAGLPSLAEPGLPTVASAGLPVPASAGLPVPAGAGLPVPAGPGLPAPAGPGYPVPAGPGWPTPQDGRFGDFRSAAPSGLPLRPESGLPLRAFGGAVGDEAEALDFDRKQSPMRAPAGASRSPFGGSRPPRGDRSPVRRSDVPGDADLDDGEGHRAQGRVTMEGLPPSTRAPKGSLFATSRSPATDVLAQHAFDDPSDDSLPPVDGPVEHAGMEFALEEAPVAIPSPGQSIALQLDGPTSGVPEPDLPLPDTEQLAERQAPLVPIRRRRSMRIRVGLVAVLALALGGGLLSLTPLGPYGIFFITDKLNRSDYEQAVTTQRESAMAALDPDTVVDAQRAVGGARAAQAELPRFAPMASYAAFLGFATTVRFGPNGANQAYATEVLSTTASREPGDLYQLALAAQDAADGRLPGAAEKLAALAARLPDDLDVAVLAAEVELASKKPAVDAWKRAIAIHASARTHFGLARAELAAGDDPSASGDARKVLEQSKEHAGARVLLARLLAKKRDTEAEGLQLLEEVTDEKGPVRKNASQAEIVAAYAQLGQIHLDRSRISQAEAAFVAALKLDPRALGALVGHAELLFRSGRFTEAYGRYQAAMSANAESVEASVGAAKTLLAQEKAKDAKTLLKKMEAAGVKDPRVGYWLGQAEAALGNRQDAEAAYRRAIGLGETDLRTVQSYVALANMLGARGDTPGAEQLLAEAESKLPGNSALHAAKGDFAMTAGRYDDAKHELSKALELDPNDLAVRFKLASALRRADDFAAAARTLDEVAKADPEYPGLALERGLMYEAQGDSERAIAAYQSALEKAPEDVDLKFRVGSAQVIAGHAKQAIDLLKKVLEARPQSAEVNYYLGRAYLVAATNLPQALRLLQTATERDPNRAEYFLYLGWAANEIGDSEQAAQALQRALEIDQANGDAYWQRAVLLQKKGQSVYALNDAKKALELRPSRFEAFATIAFCYQDQSDWSAAKEAWRRAIAGNRRVAEWHYRLGKILAQERDEAGAAEALGKAVALATDPKAPPGPKVQWLADAHFLLAEALRATGDREHAIEQYNAFRKAAPMNHPYRRDADDALRALGAPPEP